MVTTRSISKFLLLALTLTSLDSHQASSEAFSPRQSSLGHNSRLVGGNEVLLSQNQKVSNPSVAMTSAEEYDENGDPELFLRGGGQSKIDKKLLREMVAEMIGTFIIVQIGTASVMSGIFTDSLDLFSIASTWIIAVTIAISTTADVSGAHLNPAISIAFALLRPSTQFGWRKVIPYCCAQLFGAILGSGVNLALYGSTIAAFERTNNVVRATASGLASAKAFGEYFMDPVTPAVAFLAEAFGTGVLSFVIFSLTNKKNNTAKTGYVPLLIGGTVGSLIAIIAPLTQAGFNPARDFGPRIVAFLAGWKEVAFQGWWVYVLGPIVGAVVGAAVADKVLFVEDEK